MKKKLNYCRGVVVVHGKSEKLLAEHIKSNLHLPIEVYAENNGKTSIQIDSLITILNNNIFKNERCLKRKYKIEIENKKIKNFFLIVIMDLDDTTEEKIKQYKSGKMFEKHWLSPYIIPVWNNKNLDQVMFDLGLISKVPNYKEKGRVYEEVFPKNNGELDKKQIENLYEKFKSSKKTNMDIFIEECLKLLGE